jgi:hypothetical protein
MPARSAPSDAIWDEEFARPADDDAQIRECIRYAVLAPSGHNTQPWTFTVDGPSVEIRADRSRAMPVGDPKDRELAIGLGCATEHLVIAARHAGFRALVAVQPQGERGCVRITLRRGSVRSSELFAAIPARHTNRRAYDGRPIPEADLAALAALGEEGGVRVRFLRSRDEFDEIVRLVAHGNDIHLNHKPFMDELISWIRFSRRSIEAHRDGLTSRAVGRPAVPDWFGRLLMRRWFTPARQTRLDAKLIRSASAIMVITSARNDERAWIDVGRAFDRILLAQTLRDIRAAHLNQNWQIPELADGLREVVDLRGEHPQLVLRIGYAAPLPHSPRRPIEHVLTEV